MFCPISKNVLSGKSVAFLHEVVFFIDLVHWPVQREECGEFQKNKIFNEAEEIASLNMGARNQYYSIHFSADLSKVYRKFLLLMCAISTRLLLVAGRASRVPKGTYDFSSIVSPRYANRGYAGHATMSTKGGNDRLIRVQALSQTDINIFANFTTLFRFLFFSRKKKEKKSAQSATMVLTLWTHRTVDELKLHFGLAR